MAKKVEAVTRFDYIAHIQKEDGNIVEIAGRRDFATHNDVYKWLQTRSSLLGGYLVSQSITEAEDDDIKVIPWKPDCVKQRDDKQKALPAPTTSVVVQPASSVFEDTSIFGMFKRTYTGAIPIKFKGSTS